MRRSVIISLIFITPLTVHAEVPARLGVPDARAAYLRTKRTQAVLRLVRALLVDGKLAEARKRLEAERRRIERTASPGTLSPDDARLLYFVGIVEEMSGSAGNRDAVFKRVRELTPTDEFTHLLLGKTFERLHREDIAAAEYRKVLSMEPEDSPYDVESLARLSHAAYTTHRHKQAVELFGKLLAMIRRRPGRTYSEEAIAHFEYLRAVSRGYALLAEGEPESWRHALDACERAWRTSPDDIDAPVLGERIARAYPDEAKSVELTRLWRGRSDRVAKVLRRKINAAPGNAVHYNALAWFLAGLDRNHEEGMRAARRAVELEPGEPAYIDTLAECTFRKGDVAGAVRTIRRVVDLHPYANDYYRQQLERFEAALKKSQTAGAP